MAEKYFGLTDTGKVRENNEDAFIAQTVLGSRYLLACVIDGVGGYEGGEVAAAIARETIIKKFSKASGNIQEMLREALLESNHAIFIEKFKNSQNQRMACVLTIAVIERESHNLYYAHVGDTRLYLLRDRSLVKITRDQSFVGFLEDSGRLNESEAMQHPKRNEINKGLGFEEPIHDPGEYFETGNSPFLPGDTILLCSDGLTDMINKETITSLLNQNVSLEDKAKNLIRAANESGGKDNITVVLVQNDSAPMKHKATRPAAGAKNAGRSGRDSTVKSSKDASPEVQKQKRSGNVLTIFLGTLCVFLIAALVWLWKKNPTADQPGNITATHTRNVYESRLSDTLVSMQGNKLILTDSLFGRSIILSDTLFINKDSIHITGTGSTVIISDTAQSAHPVIMVGDLVRYILFDSLTLQDITLHLDAKKMGILHFKNVRLQNLTVQADNAIHFPDSTYSGVLSQQEIKNDSTTK